MDKILTEKTLNDLVNGVTLETLHNIVYGFEPISAENILYSQLFAFIKDRYEEASKIDGTDYVRTKEFGPLSVIVVKDTLHLLVRIQGELTFRLAQRIKDNADLFANLPIHYTASNEQIRIILITSVEEITEWR